MDQVSPIELNPLPSFTVNEMLDPYCGWLDTSESEQSRMRRCISFSSIAMSDGGCTRELKMHQR